jgi:hypothetical protein
MYAKTTIPLLTSCLYTVYQMTKVDKQSVGIDVTCAQHDGSIVVIYFLHQYYCLKIKSYPNSTWGWVDTNPAY